MRIAVIGHGRSPEGKGWGPEIDACDLVVRMWDWDWQAPPDYGRKFDHGVVAMSRLQLAAWKARYAVEPEVSWLGFLRYGTALLPGFDPIDPTQWNEMAMGLGARRRAGAFNLTRGCAAICWAIERAGSGGEVIMVGFDNLMLGRLLPEAEAFNPDYRAHYDSAYPNWRVTGSYKAGADQHGTHDIAVERWLVSALGCEKGVTVRAAAEAWPR